MDCFEDSVLLAEIGAGDKAQSADQSCAQIGDDVAVKILHHHHVILVRIHHQLHTGVVDDVFAVGDLRIFLGDIPRAAQEKTIRKLHDVGFVDGVDFFAFVLASVFKGESSDSGRGLFGNDL